MAQKQDIGTSPIENPDAPAAPRPVAPVYGPDGRMAYGSLAALVRRGESVIVAGRHVTAANLPSELEYAAAGGDRAAVDKAAADQQATIDRLTAELAAARGEQAPAADDAPAEKKPAPAAAAKKAADEKK